MTADACKLCGLPFNFPDEFREGFHVECDQMTRLISEDDAQALAKFFTEGS